MANLHLVNISDSLGNLGGLHGGLNGNGSGSIVVATLALGELEITVGGIGSSYRNESR